MNLINGGKQNWVFTGVVVITFWLWTGNAVYGQVTKPTVLLHPQRTTILSAGCTVSQLQLRFRTGNDDLRGGQNNLNVEIHFADGTMQGVNNANRGANWGNNSTNLVTVALKQPIAPNLIKEI